MFPAIENYETKANLEDQLVPFSIENEFKEQSFIRNSEFVHEAWFIENPVTKELTKRITLKLGPSA